MEPEEDPSHHQNGHCTDADGLLIAGPVADWLGIRTWYVVGGAVTLLLAGSGFFNRTLLSIDEKSAIHKEASATPPPTVTSSA